jgi:outer membrane protein assembly factor BamB
MNIHANSDSYPQLLSGGMNRVNPHEKTLTPQNVSGLTTRWTYATGLTPWTSPVVDHGLVFEGEYGCCPAPAQVVAVNTATGARVWSFQTPAPVVATPAVAHGVLYAGDYNGTLYALNELTGSLLWKANAGNQFFDPDHITVAWPFIFTVTVTPGLFGPTQLSAWNGSGCGAPTCDPLWTAPLAAAASGPAVDAGSVYVAEADGGLYVYNASGCGTPTCDAIWEGQYSPTPSGDAYASVAITKGTVYVGNGTVPLVTTFRASGCDATVCMPLHQFRVGTANFNDTYYPGIAIANGMLYVGAGEALDVFAAAGCGSAVICSPLWQDVAAAGAKPLVANGVVYSVSGSTVLADNATTGTRLWTTAIGSSTGGPAVANGTGYVQDTAAAELLAYRV